MAHKPRLGISLKEEEKTKLRVAAALQEKSMSELAREMIVDGLQDLDVDPADAEAAFESTSAD